MPFFDESSLNIEKFSQKLSKKMYPTVLKHSYVFRGKTNNTIVNRFTSVFSKIGKKIA